MSYLLFLLGFVVTPIVGLAALAAARRLLDADVLIALGLVALLALGSALPWDAVAIARGYWFFAGPRLLGLALFGVPAEEMAFFVLETLFVGLLLVNLLGRESARVHS